MVLHFGCYNPPHGGDHPTAVTRTQGSTQALKDGSVRPDRFALRFEEVPVLVQAFRRMVRALDFDVTEMAFSTYLCAGPRQAVHRAADVPGPRLPPRRDHPVRAPPPGRSRRRRWKASGPASTAATRSPPASGPAASWPISTASTSAASPGCCPATSTWPSTSRRPTSSRRPGQDVPDMVATGELAAGIGIPATGRTWCRCSRTPSRPPATPCASAASTRSTTWSVVEGFAAGRVPGAGGGPVRRVRGGQEPLRRAAARGQIADPGPATGCTRGSWRSPAPTRCRTASRPTGR